MRRWLCLIVILAACARSAPAPDPAPAPAPAAAPASPSAERDGEPPVLYVDSEDPAMVAAIGEARRHVGVFIEHLARPRPGQSFFSVKVPVRDGEQVEHMWLADVRFVDGVFEGTINNEPAGLRGVAIGDRVRVAQSEISDWMILERGELRGGWSVRLLRDQLTPDDRAAMDRQTGIVVTERILPE